MSSPLSQVPLDQQLAEAFPHHFAPWVTQGRRRRYRWTDHAGMRVAQTIARGNGRLIFNVQPQVGKSKFFEEIIPAWFLWRWPHKNVIVASYGSEIAHRSGRECRNIIHRAQLAGLRLREDSKAAGRWNTTEGGGLIAAGVDGPVGGNPGDLIIVGDLYKSWEVAQSRTKRANGISWFDNTLRQREQQDTTYILAHTRMHRDDVCGHLLSHDRERWDHIRLPALAEAGDPLGRAVGECLCPERYTQEKTEQMRDARPSEMWNCVYQQAPDESSSTNVYRNFSEGNLDNGVEILPHLPTDIMIDYNVNPGMHILVGQYDHRTGTGWVVHEIHGPRMHLDASLIALGKLFDSMGALRPKDVRVFGDASGQSPTIGDGTSFYDRVEKALTRMGIRYRMYVPAGNPPIAERVMGLNDFLLDARGNRRLKIHRRCERLVADFRLLRVGADGLPDKADRVLSHASEAVGYWAHEQDRLAMFDTIAQGVVVTKRR